MTRSPPWRIVLAVEGPSDARRIRHLMDHVLARTVDGAGLDAWRCFEVQPGESYIAIKEIPKLARELQLDRRYSAEGPKKGDGGTLRKLRQILQKRKLLTDTVIVWQRDDDGDSARRADARSARDQLPPTPPILLAIATECLEAWILAGWNPKPDDPTLVALRQELGFAPQLSPERLSHKANAPKSAKATLERVLREDEDQELGALCSAADNAEEAAEKCGLAEFCREVLEWARSAACSGAPETTG